LPSILFYFKEIFAVNFAIFILRKFCSSILQFLF